MLGSRKFRTRRKFLRAPYTHVYKRARDFLRPKSQSRNRRQGISFGLQKSIQKMQHI